MNDDRACPPANLHCGERLTRVFQLLGKRWTGMILGLLLQRPARFSELARAVPGLSERVMSERLQELIAEGLVERRVDPGPPLGTTYALTAAGERLRPAMQSLMEWAETLPHRAPGCGPAIAGEAGITPRPGPPFPSA